MKRFIACLWVSLFLVGCTQDPVSSLGKLEKEPPKPPTPAPPSYFLDVPENLEYQEGETLQTKIRAEVPSPGFPSITVKDMPEGMAFDPSTFTLSWTPSFDAANDPRDTAVTHRVYVIHWTLGSTQNPLTTVQKETALVVHDKARKPKFTFEPAEAIFTEGTKGVQKLTIESEDFPEGPFEVRAALLPATAEIRATSDPKVFQISYVPDALAADVNDSVGPDRLHYRSINTRFIVNLPRGPQFSENSQWKIFDKRLLPKVSGPKSVSQGLDVSFTLGVEDPNGEDLPEVSLKEAVSFGNFSMTKLESTSGAGKIPTAIYGIRWTQIPNEKMGTTSPLIFRVCNHKVYYWDYDNCTESTVSVTFNGTLVLAPSIDRRDYPLGVIKYARVNESFTVRIPVRDPQSGMRPKVEIDPPEMASEVTYSNSYVEIKPTKVGVRQFNLIATSSSGVARSESFVFEALPALWSPVLVLGETPTASESVKTLDLFENAQLVNPEFQELDTKMMALRSTMSVTTKALSLSGMGDLIDSWSDRFPSFAVLSPLADRTGGKLTAEWETYGVKVLGRLQSLPEAPIFSALAVTPANFLTQPAGVVRLAGNLTAESANPLVFSFDGTREESRACKKVLSLTATTPATDLVLAVKCTRKGGGTLLISGAEWGDFSTSPADAKIAKRWMTEVIKP